MSFQVQKLIWDIDLAPNLKFTLQAMAHFADDSGKGIFAGASTIAKMTNYTERNIRRLVKQLVKMGYLILQGKRKHANNYDINMDKLSQNQEGNPDNLSPLTLTNCPDNPDKLSPEYIIEQIIDPIKEEKESPIGDTPSDASKDDSPKKTDWDRLWGEIADVLVASGYDVKDKSTRGLIAKIRIKFKDSNLQPADVVPLMREAYTRIKNAKKREPEVGEYLWKTHFIEYKRNQMQCQDTPSATPRKLNISASRVS